MPVATRRSPPWKAATARSDARKARVAELADALDLGGNQDHRQGFGASPYAVVTSEFGALALAPVLLQFFCIHFARIAFAQQPACEIS